MTNPCIICVAITGSVPTKANNPAVPITILEQIESTHEAFEAGAAIVHAHVRNDDQTPSSDPEKFARLKEGLEKHCPGMIIQFSTGGRSGAGQARGGMLSLRPDMASLSVGSNNFPTRVYENPPDLVDWLAAEMLTYDVKPEIEAFDLSHIFKAREMADKGQLAGTPYVQFVMGVKNAMPVDREVFEFYVHTVQRLFGADAPWCAAGIGAQQIVLNEWAIAAVFLGMTLTRDGQPRVLATLAGVVVLGVLDNGLTQMRVDSYIRQVLVGAIILLAVGLSALGRRGLARR
jgi:uncharacterized protein (DUF849 family)